VVNRIWSEIEPSDLLRGSLVAETGGEVVGDPGYYGTRGFATGSAHGLQPPSARTPGPSFQVVLNEGYETWMTGQVIYPDVWWRHDAAGLRDPLLSELEELMG